MDANPTLSAIFGTSGAMLRRSVRESSLDLSFRRPNFIQRIEAQSVMFCWAVMAAVREAESSVEQTAVPQRRSTPPSTLASAKCWPNCFTNVYRCRALLNGLS
jgi:hypothetical protein